MAFYAEIPPDLPWSTSQGQAEGLGWADPLHSDSFFLKKGIIYKAEVASAAAAAQRKQSGLHRVPFSQLPKLLHC